MNSTHSSFKRFVPRLKEIWPFVIGIISIMIGKRFRKVTASSENRIDPLSGCRTSHVEMTDSDNSSDRDDEIFYSPLVQSIRKNHANIEKIASYEWEDMENQDYEVPKNPTIEGDKKKMNSAFYCNDCFADVEEECMCNRIIGCDAKTGVPIVDISDYEWYYLYGSRTKGTD